MEQKIDTILTRIDTLTAITTETREMVEPVIQKVSKLEENQEVLNEKVYDIQCQVAWLEQYGMKNDIVITGLTEEQEEKEAKRNRSKENRATRKAVINFIGKLGIAIEERDMVIAHRLPITSKGNEIKERIPNEIVRFVCNEIRCQVLTASKEKKLKNEANENIYCNEHLLQYTWEMLSAARRYRDDEIFKYAWISDGKVLVREDDKSKVIRIWSCNQLDHMVDQIKEERSSQLNNLNGAKSGDEVEAGKRRNEVRSDTRNENGGEYRELRYNVKSKYRKNPEVRPQNTIRKYVTSNKTR